MRMIRLATITLAAIALCAPNAARSADKHAAIDTPAPDFTLTDMDGKAHKLSDYKGKFVVLEWNNPDCPFVKKFYKSGTMQRMQTTAKEKDIVWLTICSSAKGKQGYYESADLKTRMKDAKLASTAYLRDPSGSVGHMYEAKTTPHMFVIDPEGVLIYAGAMDDKPSTSVEDLKGATNYVHACLMDAAAGTKVKTAATTPYGCSIKYSN